VTTHRPSAPPSSLVLADALEAFVVERLEALIDRHLAGFRVPGVFAGHVVAPDVRADLAFTLGLLHAGGLERVAGHDAVEAIGTVLRPIDGPGTHTFFSYRVSETLARFGPFATNAVMAGWSAAERHNLAAACDSSSWIELLDGDALPRNYAAVLARCELGRLSLGLLDEGSGIVEDLAGRAAARLRDAPSGLLDDSQSGIGRYDIYSADTYLFTEPLADRMGPVWEHGARSALDLVERVATTDGTAIAWGRSTGALGVCLTVELAALAVRQPTLSDEPGRWLLRAASALDHLAGWFAGDGVITAHQHRSPFDYRGPARRLQMTLDCLGKLADAALSLRGANPVLDTNPSRSLWPERHELVSFDARGRAAVWTYRSRQLAFVLPLVGSTVSDYLPSPRNPGLFEVPVGSPLVTGVPLVVAGGHRYVAGNLPAAMTLIDGGLTDGGLTEDGLTVHHEGFWPAGRFELENGSHPLAGCRRVTYRVDGRTLRAEEKLSFHEVPQSVSLAVPEADGRPLRVDFACPSPHAVATIDTSGMKEWRSFWSELPVVHQIDIDPARTMRFSWSVTPKLRVLTSAADHHYHRSLYNQLVADGRVVDRQVPWGRLHHPGALAALFERWDQFHLHWPEWLLGDDLAAHLRFIATLQRSGVRIIWTQHNLAPHAGAPIDDVYQAWAGATDGAIHHSRWGQEQVTARYQFRENAMHRVIPHGHFPNSAPEAVRAEVEAEHGLTPGMTRLAVVGAPRPGKDVGLVMDAFAASDRRDLELWVLSLGPEEVAQAHPGIVARPYEMVDRHTYDRRLVAVDALVLPFDHRMLTTGTVGDAIGHGLPAITSDWPYLAEALGDAAITYGATVEDLAECLRSLDAETLAAAARASQAKQDDTSWPAVADQTFDLLGVVGTARL